MTARHEDAEIICRDCSSPFTLTTGDKDFFQRRGLQLPKRCKACRALRRVEVRPAMNTELTRETRSERVLTSRCGHCGDTFEPTRPHQKFCKPSCRRAAFTGRREPAQVLTTRTCLRCRSNDGDVARSHPGDIAAQAAGAINLSTKVDIRRSESSPPSRCDCCKIRPATVEENSRPACLCWQCSRRYR